MTINTPDKKIDGFPKHEVKKFRRLNRASLTRRVAYKAIDHFLNGGPDCIVTWVNSEQAWDGHALAMCLPTVDEILLEYFHINRDKKRIIQHSQIELDISSPDDIEQDKIDTDELLAEATLEFDRDNLEYVLAMIAKASLKGRTPTSCTLDKTVMGVLYEENLDRLCELFPQREIKTLPYASERFMQAIREVVERDGLSEGDRSIYLRRNLKNDEMLALYLQLSDGEPQYGVFIRNVHENWASDIHDYERDSSESEGCENEWDIKKLIKTLKTGIEIDKTLFETYQREANQAEIEDSREYTMRLEASLEKRVKKKSQ